MKSRIRGLLAAVAAGAALTGAVVTSPALAEEDGGDDISFLTPQDVIAQVLELIALGEERKPIEAIPTTQQIVETTAFGDERVVVAHGTNALGDERTVFSLMAFEPDLQEWYPAETWDRPSGGEFSWAQFTLADGQNVLVWDELPAGQVIDAAGDLIENTAITGTALIADLVDEAEVVLQ